MHVRGGRFVETGVQRAIALEPLSRSLTDATREGLATSGSCRLVKREIKKRSWVAGATQPLITAAASCPEYEGNYEKGARVVLPWMHYAASETIKLSWTDTPEWTLDLGVICWQDNGLAEVPTKH